MRRFVTSTTVAGMLLVGISAVRAQTAGRAAVLPGEGYYAANLGITYQLVPYGASSGARLIRHPAAGSPAARLQLEPGDTIVSLDGQAIVGPQDVTNHVAQTSVTFVNVRDGRLYTRVVQLPGADPGPPPGPFPPPTGYKLGVVTVPVALNDGQAAVMAPTPGRRPAYRPVPTSYGLQLTQVFPGGAAGLAGLEPGDTIVTANNIATTSHAALQQAINSSGGTLRLLVKNGRQPYNYVNVTVDLQAPLRPFPTSPAPTSPPMGPGPFTPGNPPSVVP